MKENIWGIIGAMEIEVAALKEKMTVESILERASMKFYKGTLYGKKLVVVQCGVGKVHAAVCTQILADEFQVTAVINTGIAGSLSNDINIGDIVISTDAVHHDFTIEGLGYKKGVVPGFQDPAFKADENLIESACVACKKVNPDIQVFRGRIATGDQFVADRDTKSAIVGDFAASCTEMEGCAIAQTAVLNHIPFVIVRAISDKADNSSVMDYPTFEKQAAEHSVKLVEEMVRQS